MLYGSIPIGFSEPLKEQLEKGIEIENIQCDNSNVLVQRTNGKLACVSELTAEKMEWEIISSIQKIVYDYPLNANSFENEQFGSEPITLFGTVELSISKLPKVGETATLTYTYTQTSEHQPYDPYLYHGISLFEPFSFVNQTDVEFVAADPEIYYDRDFEGIVKPVEHMNVNDTMTWIVEFTAVEEGQGTIRAGNADARTGYSMFVGEEETLLYDDYIALYGEPVRIQRSEPFLTNEKLWELHLEALEDDGNSTFRACYDVPRNERLELYEALNLTEAEIQKEFENCAAQHLAIQSLSDPIPKIVYDYPISSKGPLTNSGENISSSSMFWGGDIEIIISKLPKVGETADVTIIFTNLSTHDTINWFEKGFAISRNLEFVNLTSETNDHIYYIDEPLKILKQNETETVSFTIKAVGEGRAVVSAIAMMGIDEALSMFISEEETILYADYRKLHPPAQALPPFDLGPGEIWDPYGVVRETYDPLDDSYDSFAELSRSELREELMEMGFEGEELEEVFKEMWAESHPNLNTQSFLDSIIPKAYASSHYSYT